MRRRRTLTIVAFALAACSGGHYVFDCTDPQKCTEAFLPDYTPANVKITVTTAQGSRVLQFTPVYSTNQPNGPNCPETCRSAIVTASLP